MRDPADTPKHWLKSKTILFNVAIAVLTVLASEVDALHSLLSEKSYTVLMLVIVLGNAVLRTLTHTPLTKPRLRRRATKAKG